MLLSVHYIYIYIFIFVCVVVCFITSNGRFAVDWEFEYIESVSSRPLVELFGPSGELVGPPRGVFEPTGELFGSPGGGPEI